MYRIKDNIIICTLHLIFLGESIEFLDIVHRPEALSPGDKAAGA
jgi:hypothetical protein